MYRVAESDGAGFILTIRLRQLKNRDARLLHPFIVVEMKKVDHRTRMADLQRRFWVVVF